MPDLAMDERPQSAGVDESALTPTFLLRPGEQPSPAEADFDWADEGRPDRPATVQRAPNETHRGEPCRDALRASSLPSVPGYEVLGELGRGNMGVVYKARQLSLDRLVALKMVRGGAHASPDDVGRFLAEARVVAQLHHGNIVQVYEVGLLGELPYFSMEYVEGGTLAQRLAGRPLPVRQAAEVVEVLARAMHYAHQRGVIHRDLKPANILFQIADCRLQIENSAPASSDKSSIFNLQSAIPKITDFGLAKQLDGGSGQTASGMIMGTPNYMAPEQAQGNSKAVGPAADIYALGAILYEALTGRPPHNASTPLETVLQICQGEPVAPSRLQPKVPRDLETVCLLIRR